MVNETITDKSVDNKKPLPKGWKWVGLREISIVGPDNGIFKKRHEFGRGVPIVNVLDLFRDIKLDLSKVERVEVTKTEEKKYSIAKGDLFFCRSSLKREGIGWCCYALEVEEPSVFECHVMRVRLNPEIALPEFIAYYWRLSSVREEVIGKAKTSTMTTMNQEDLASIKIPLPPLAEQKRIAAILSEQLAAVERARKAAQEQLEAAKALPAAYLREVFESEEAKRWEKRKLGEICEIISKQVNPTIAEFSSLPHVNGENIEKGSCRLLNLRSAAEDSMTSNKYLFDGGEVLYSKLRPYLRKAVVVDFRGVCSADMYPIKVKSQHIEAHFLCWMLVSDTFTKYAEEESRRARMPKLNREQLFSWDAFVPPLSLQKLIVQKLREKMSNIEILIQRLKDQLNTINKLPSALLQRAFSGQL